MNRFLKISFSLLLIISVGLATLAGCSGETGKIKIGVVQLVEHPALDASYQGFVDALKDAGYVDGDKITISY